tara:strand:- start:237 stop:461 length:225 start_codon:yes stop_codon:yes gene_type:complete
MATKKDSINFNRNPLVDVSWQGTVTNCQQVIRFVSSVNYIDFGEEEAVGFFHVLNTVNDALQYASEQQGGRRNG